MFSRYFALLIYLLQSALNIGTTHFFRNVYSSALYETSYPKIGISYRYRTDNLNFQNYFT